MEQREEGRGQPARGVFGSLRRLLATLLEVAQTRIALVATELEEQRLRSAQLLMIGFVTMFMVGMAMMFGTLFVVVTFWDNNRTAALGGVTLFYLVLAAIAGAVWYRCHKARPHLFEATLAELQKDRDELEPGP